MVIYHFIDVGFILHSFGSLSETQSGECQIDMIDIGTYGAYYGS